MKKVAIAVVILGAIFWIKQRFVDPPKPKESSKAEVIAESVGRIARAKREGRTPDSSDLKVIESAVPAVATAAQTSTATPDALQNMLAAATSTAPPEQRAKQRVQQMMDALQAGGPQETAMA